MSTLASCLAELFKGHFRGDVLPDEITEEYVPCTECVYTACFYTARVYTACVYTACVYTARVSCDSTV